MSISVRCQNCRKEYRVDDRLAGKKARCKQCGAVMSVPEPVTELTDADLAVEDPFTAMEQLESSKVMEKKFTPNVSPAAVGNANPKPAPARSPATNPMLPAPQMVGPILPPQIPLDYHTRTKKKYASRAPVEGATPMLVLGYLLAHASYTVIKLVQIYTHEYPGLPDKAISEIRRNAFGIAITGEIAQVLLFFALVTPLVMLAIWLAGKVMRFGMPDGLYLKSAGVAALPGVMLGLTLLLPSNLVMIIMCLAATVPVAIYVLMFAFGLDWGETGITFAFTAIFYTGGQLFSFLVLMGVMVAAVAGARVNIDEIAARYQQPDTSISSGPSAGNSGGSTSSGGNSAPADSIGDRVRFLRERIVNATQDRALEGYTREEFLAALTEMRRQAQDLKNQRDDASTQELFAMIDEARRKAASLPSKDPGPELFQDLIAAEEWSPSDPSSPLLGDEVSFRNFKLRPLKETLLDLRTSENSEQGLAWAVSKREEHGRIQVALFPKSNPKQRRPWVAQRPFQLKAAEDAKLFAVDATQASFVTGTVNGLKFTRIAYKPGEHSFERWVKYVAEDGDYWLVMTLITGKDDAQMLESLDLAAKTLRKQRGGEERVDPFAPARIAARLADNPEGASAILRKIGKGAEDAVLPYLKSDNPIVRERAAMVLGDVGSDKSLPILRELARGKGKDRALARVARAAWRKLAPKELDNVDEAMMDLDSEDFQVQRAAMESLAKEKPDARREKIAPILENQFLTEAGFFTQQEAGAALEVWFGSKTASHLVAYLNNPRNEHDRRLKQVINIVAATKDPQGVHPIIQWVNLQESAVKAALIRMGPVAEDETLKLIESTFPAKVRIAAAEVLEQIGTIKTLRRIVPFTKDKRDPSVQTAMTAAYEAVKARVDSK